MDYEKKIDIPFGAKDSELKGWEYTIPEGMEAIIKDGKVIVREKESENEKIRRQLINVCNDLLNGDYSAKPCLNDIKWLKNLLENQKEQKSIEDIVKDITKNKEVATKFLKSAGIMDDNGELAEMYRSEEQKSTSYSPLCNTIKDKIREYVTNHFVTDTVVKTDVKSIVKAMEEGVRLGEKEQKPAEWGEEDETCLQDVLWCIEKAEEVVAKDENYMGICWCARRWLKFLPERFNLQPKPEWSDKDEKMKESIIKALYGGGHFAYEPEITWLKSLRPRLKQMISEDTEVLMVKLINLLKSYRIGEETATTLANRIADTYGTQRYMDGLCDSEKLHWKPSEEQMIALENVIKCELSAGLHTRARILQTLQNDLKKL